MSKATRQTRFSLLLLFLVFAVAVVFAGDPPTPPAPAQLQEAPSPATSPSNPPETDGGSISDPTGGTDAKAILAGSSHSMGSSDDATDSGNEDDAKDPNAASKGPNAQQKDAQSTGGHHGQCVIACATKSTDGAGCGKDLSKPDCFCKSESFITQTFSCVSATCPQQFHGAAGVVTSICSVAGAPNLTIPGYSPSDNLEHMPTINDNGNKTNSTATTPTTPNPPGSGAGAATSTFSMPVGVQTPTSGSPPSSGNSPTSGSSGQNTSASNTGTGVSSSAGAAQPDTVGVLGLFTAAAVLASVGAWTLF